MARKRKTDIDRSRNALALTEQAFHLLRTAPLAAHCWCYLGMVPFAVGLLFFSTEMSRGAHAEDHLINASLGIALVYLWMKICQAMFCRRLWQQLSPGRTLPQMTLSRIVRYGAVQVFLHAFAPIFLCLGALFLLPLGWIIAFFQNVTVFGYTLDFDRRALRGIAGISVRQSHFAAMQNHLLLAMLKAFALFTWLNVALICAGLPQLAKLLLGVESVFTHSWQAAYLNSTFLAIIVIGAWFVLSPFTKAIYVVRCFEGISEKTGADLIARLESNQRDRALASASQPDLGPIARSRPGRVLTMLLTGSILLAGCGASIGQVVAQDDVTRMQDARAALDKVMARPEFEWRMPRAENEAGGDADNDGNVIADWIVSTQKAIGDFIQDAFEALGDLIDPPDFSPPGSGSPSFGSGFNFLGMGVLETLVYVALIVLVLVLIGMLSVFLVRRYRDAEDLGDDESVGQVVDLKSEELLADELPEDEWLKLAREQVEKGEPRLAVRALFLASLAHLAGRNLLRIIKSKSNRDYRRELHMKARGQERVLDAFDGNVKTFERVWYGMHDPTEGIVDEFTKNYERIKGA
ncbi:MAG: hypothetical protein O3C21_07695 [Verrucomicrobia bacterium]|nr:hypothetical protein [Verrucomicrobiota bacterium]